MAHYIGVDLAWGEGSTTKSAKETGLISIDAKGNVIDAGWARGIDDVVAWLTAAASPGDVIAIDAPLVVTNATGMRECERQVGQRYGRWKVSANATNLTRLWQGGVTLRKRLEDKGFSYTSGENGPVSDVVQFFECYPYTALVGAEQFGYATERPRYKRSNLGLPADERRAFRAAECDELLSRFARFSDADPPLDLATHPVTAELLNSPSPTNDVAYKHREDLLDAAICAWTASMWACHGSDACQVLGLDDVPDGEGRRPTIVAPARPEQRRDEAAPVPRASSIALSSSPTSTELVMQATRLLGREHRPRLDPGAHEYARLELLRALDALR